MEVWVENILSWISNNPHWAGLAVFMIAFLESLAIVGLAMPGWLLLVGVGTLVGGGSLNFWLMSLFSFLGAFSGQALSYAFGYHFKERVHHWKWVESHRGLMTKAEVFFKKHGFAGILIGQFIGPIRAVISLMAGILAMPAKNFFLAIFLATIIWAPVYLLPGVLLGAALTFDKSQVWILLAGILILVACLWLIGRFIKDWYLQSSKTATEDSQSLSTLMGKKRLLAFLASCTGLVLVSGFFLLTEYGALLADLLSKIWQVIS